MTTEATMKAAVYGRPGQIAWAPAPAPTIEQPTDVIVKTMKRPSCVTDHQILRRLSSRSDGAATQQKMSQTDSRPGPTYARLSGCGMREAANDPR